MELGSSYSIIPGEHKGLRSEDCSYRVDMLVENRLIISGGVLNRINYYIPSN